MPPVLCVTGSIVVFISFAVLAWDIGKLDSAKGGCSVREVSEKMLPFFLWLPPGGEEKKSPVDSLHYSV